MDDGGGVRSHKIQLLLLFFSFKCENFVIPKIGCYRKLLQDARVEAEKSMSKSSYRNWRWVESSDSSVEWFWVFVVERAALWSNREREQRKIGISFQGVMLITFGCSRCRRRSLEVWGQYIRWYFILTRKFVSLSLTHHLLLSHHHSGLIKKLSHRKLLCSITISSNNRKFFAFNNSSGWGEGSEKYSVMAETEESRNIFAESVLRFLAFYGFDGVSRF